METPLNAGSQPQRVASAMAAAALDWESYVKVSSSQSRSRTNKAGVMPETYAAIVVTVFRRGLPLIKSGTG